MSLARLVIAAVRVDGRSKSEVARDYEVSRYWVQQLVRRFETEGEAAYQPRSRRPHHSPNAVPARLEDQIIRLRKELSKQGLDAGADDPGPPRPRHPGIVAGGVDDLAGSDQAGVCDPAAAETAEIIVDPVPGRTAERTLAGRHHPLAAG
jgi:hypothetical protein